MFIGDRLDSDIAFANGHGIPSILVETGVHKRSDVEPGGIVPAFTVANLYELLIEGPSC